MRKTRNKKLYLLTTGIVIVAALMPMIFQSQSSTTSLESSYVEIEHAVVTDSLNDHNYAVFVGAKWKRINGYFGDYFYSSDQDYEDNLASSSGDFPDDWYQMGSEYDLDHTVGSYETADTSTQRSWQKPKGESGYELIIWVQLVWKYTFIGTTYHRGYDYQVIYSWASGGQFVHEFHFEGAYGEDFNGAVECTLKIWS